MQRQIESIAFGFVGDAKADHRIDDLENHEADHARIGDREDDRDRLRDELARIAFQQPCEPAGVASLADKAPTANTPVNNAPMMPPTPCTPNTSRESS